MANCRPGGCVTFRVWFMAGACLLFAFPSFAQVALLPDLQAFPAFDLAVIKASQGQRQLEFSTRTWNSGDGPLELRAGETGDAGQNVYQRVYESDDSFYDRLAGTFTWHPSHNHFHFNDYALYTLIPAGASTGPQSGKTTFCIMDTNAIDTSLPGAPQQAVYSTCGDTIQGMSVGWADTYGYNLAGQSINITGLADGDYALMIEVDPSNRILEVNDSNNSSCVLIHLSVKSGAVQVLDPNGCSSASAVSVSGIDPDSGSQDTVFGVTITGDGYTPGMAVSFENDSGPHPTASDVVVVDENTITANVTVHKKAKIGSVWDVRVDSGVLEGGFHVVP